MKAYFLGSLILVSTVLSANSFAMGGARQIQPDDLNGTYQLLKGVPELCPAVAILTYFPLDRTLKMTDSAGRKVVSFNIVAYKHPQKQKIHYSDGATVSRIDSSYIDSDGNIIFQDYYSDDSDYPEIDRDTKFKISPKHYGFTLFARAIGRDEVNCVYELVGYPDEHR